MDRTDRKLWKAGVFYYNPDDPELVVPKRVGVGRTLNMARRASWFIIGGPMLAIGLIEGFVTARSHR